MEELFDIVDADGQPTGQVITRSEAHRLGTRHRTAHIWVVRRHEGQWELLLQKRSREKDSFPGCWDTSSAGHIHAGDEPLPSALRELEEELGLRAGPEDLIPVGHFDIKFSLPFHGHQFIDDEYVNVYAYMRDADPEKLKLQAEEVEEARWFSAEDVRQKCVHGDSDICVPMNGLQVILNYLEKLK